MPDVTQGLDLAEVTDAIGDMLVKARQVEVFGDSEVGALLGDMLRLQLRLVEQVAALRTAGAR